MRLLRTHLCKVALCGKHESGIPCVQRKPIGASEAVHPAAAVLPGPRKDEGCLYGTKISVLVTVIGHREPSRLDPSTGFAERERVFGSEDGRTDGG